jgi:hypothetical protein
MAIIRGDDNDNTDLLGFIDFDQIYGYGGDGGTGTAMGNAAETARPLTGVIKGLLLSLVVSLALFAGASKANAQRWYYVNGMPATPAHAQLLATYGFPLGYYWLRANGDYGMVGSPVVWGNLYASSGNGGGKSLSQRGLLWNRGDLSGMTVFGR